MTVLQRAKWKQSILRCCLGYWKKTLRRIKAVFVLRFIPNHLSPLIQILITQKCHLGCYAAGVQKQQHFWSEYHRQICANVTVLLCSVSEEENFIFFSSVLWDSWVCPSGPFVGQRDTCWGDDLRDRTGHLSPRLPAAYKGVWVSVLAAHCPQQCQRWSTDKRPEKLTECKPMLKNPQVILQAPFFFLIYFSFLWWLDVCVAFLNLTGVLAQFSFIC